MKSTDWRALCAELADELQGYASANPHHDSDALVARARAALAAEPVAASAGPTDDELLELWFSEGWDTSASWGAVEFARAVLARWGRSAPAPAEGEVGELVRWLRGANWDGKRQSLATRAADLLEQRHPTPVPVAERLPGPEDCDAEGRCWFLRFPFDYSRESWSLEDRTYGCNTGFTHWLPAHALPLPSGEVE